MSIPTPAAVSAPAAIPAVSQNTPVDLNPAADAAFEVRWAAWQARGRVHDAATRRHAFIGAPMFALVAVGLYLVLGR
jgi:hypothetical protein